MKRLSLAVAFMTVVAVTSACKTPKGQSDAKDIESVTKLNVSPGTGPTNEQIGVIECAPGFKDGETDKTKFGVPWTSIKDLSMAQLEARFCTVPIDGESDPGSGNPGGGGGSPGGAVKSGFYAADGAAPFCSSLKVQTKLQAGALKGLNVTCLDNNQVTAFTCTAATGTCKANALTLEFFDGGAIEIKSDVLSTYTFTGEQDVCAANGGKRVSGFCWFFSDAVSKSCINVCTAKSLTWDETSAVKSSEKATCNQLATVFGMPVKDFHEGGTSLGCVYCTNQFGGTCNPDYVGVFTTAPTVGTAQSAYQRPFCACK